MSPIPPSIDDPNRVLSGIERLFLSNGDKGVDDGSFPTPGLHKPERSAGVNLQTDPSRIPGISDWLVAQLHLLFVKDKASSPAWQLL